MAISAKDLGILRLNVDERLALVDEILESLNECEERDQLTQAQLEELDRRIVDADAHPEEGIPWEQVKAEAEARLRRPRA